MPTQRERTLVIKLELTQDFSNVIIKILQHLVKINTTCATVRNWYYYTTKFLF